MPVIDKLRELRTLLTPPENWTKGAMARNEAGESLLTAATPGAVCFCLLGGVQKVSPDPGERYDIRRQINDAILQRYQSSLLIQDFNDDETTTHHDVLTVIDWAIDHAA